MAKRVYQVAKALGLKGVEIVHYLRSEGFDVKSHMSPITDEMIEAIDRKYKPVKEEKPKKVVKKTAKKAAKKAVKKAAPKATKKSAKKVAAKKPVAAEPEVEVPEVDQPEIVAPVEETPEVVSVPEPVTAEEEKPTPAEEPVSTEESKDESEPDMAIKVSRQERAGKDESPDGESSEVEEKGEPEKPVEEEKPKPRVIRYAPGMEPGARRPQAPAPQGGNRPGGAGGQAPQQRYGGQGGPGGPGGRGGGNYRSPGGGYGGGGGRFQGSGTPGAFGANSPGQKPAGAGADADRGKKRRKKKGAAHDQEIKRSVRQTIASLGERGGGKKRRRGGAPEISTEKTVVEEKLLRILPLSTLAELAHAMKVDETEVIATCLRSGLMVTINQRLEKEDIELIATEYEFEVEFMSEFETAEEVVEEVIPEDELQSRAPVVTVMGHVDHGKTKLLDFIRKAKVAEGEAGAITQHIGAYSVDLPGGRIAFIDTPGHEAFTAMRARGTQLTDIVILVVAADDGVMPQTVEAIDHAKAAQVPIIIAINKIDLPAANPDRVKQELLQHGITVEEFGGNIPAIPISAKQGDGVDKLLEMILLQAEMLELKGAPDRQVKGTIVEARKDPGRGVLCTVLVHQGTLKIGDPFSVGLHYGTVRALVNEWGDKIQEAGPATPVEILGSNGVPEAGDTLAVMESEVQAREVSTKRLQLRREQEIRYQRHITLDELYSQINQGEVQELKLVLKGDVSGSVEAMADSFQKLSTDEVKVMVIHKSVGTVNESDVLLAAASNAIIIGFHVRPQVSVRELAKRENVEIRTYNIIYEAVEELKAAMGGLLSPVIKEKVLGTVEVRQIFRVPKIGVIAGCHVIDGYVERKSQIRIVRDGVVLGTRKISSLKRFKEDVTKVESGYECGIGLVDYQDLKEGDTLESFTTEEIARTL